MKQIFGLLLLCLPFLMQAQQKPERRFSASILAGLNFSQIDGDQTAGYSKIGPNVGARAGIWLNRRFEISTEVLYSQKGSFARKNGNDFHYNLHYVEIPVEFNLREWFVTDAQNREYARFVAGLGFSYNQLVGGMIKIGGGKFPALLDGIRKQNVAAMVTLTFFPIRNFGLNFRFAYSLYAIHTKDLSQRFHLNVLTLRAVYAF